SASVRPGGGLPRAHGGGAAPPAPLGGSPAPRRPCTPLRPPNVVEAASPFGYDDAGKFADAVCVPVEAGAGGRGGGRCARGVGRGGGGGGGGGEVGVGG